MLGSLKIESTGGDVAETTGGIATPLFNAASGAGDAGVCDADGTAGVSAADGNAGVCEADAAGSAAAGMAIGVESEPELLRLE